MTFEITSDIDKNHHAASDVFEQGEISDIKKSEEPDVKYLKSSLNTAGAKVWLAAECRAYRSAVLLFFYRPIV